MARELRFGVAPSSAQPGTRYWTLRAAARRPELYLRGSRTGSFFGVSLHEDPEHWHWKIARPGELPEYKTWTRPAQLVPGYTRAVEVVVHTVTATYGPQASSKSKVVWYVPSVQDLRIHFNLFIESPGANLDGWPAKNHGSLFIGRVDLSDGSTAVVVATESAHEEQTWTLPRPDEETLQRMLAAVDSGQSWLILMGVGDDGTAWLLESPVEGKQRSDDVPAP